MRRPPLPVSLLCVVLAPACLGDNPLTLEVGETEAETETETGAGLGLDAGQPPGRVDTPQGHLTPWCGDGVVSDDERCDDANETPDDGCEIDCQPSVGISMISVGQRPFTCAVTFGGELGCFGTNGFGELGLGTFEHVGDDELPITAGPVFIWAAVKSVAAGGRHACALDDEGGVWCWGMSESGQSGLGSVAHVAYPEAKVSLGGPAVEVVSGLDHSCARRDDGAVVCWGSNAWGQLGYAGEPSVGDDASAYAAGTVVVGEAVTDLAAGGNTTCAVLASGTVRCWGANGSGQLGLGHRANIGDDEPPASAVALDFGAPVVQVGVGQTHACARLIDGSLRCWGEGPAHGHPGVDFVGTDSPASNWPAVEIGEPVAEVACGATQTCVRNAAGDVRCFGRGGAGLGHGAGHDGAIGDDEPPSAALPVELGAPARSLAAGQHVCARLAGGTMRCFGIHVDGSLGLPWLAPGEGIGDDEAPLSQPAVQLF